MKVWPAGLPVLGADTAVVLDGELLGKPHDRDSALAMLARLSGRSHRVLTAVALVDGRGSQLRLSDSEVQFRTSRTRRSARATGTAASRATRPAATPSRAWARSSSAACEGSYSGVMGLPLFETAELLDAAGVPRWQRRCGRAGAAVAEAAG